MGARKLKYSTVKPSASSPRALRYGLKPNFPYTVASLTEAWIETASPNNMRSK